MNQRFGDHLVAELASIESAGLYKHERQITTPQGALVGVQTGGVNKFTFWVPGATPRS